MNAASGAVWAGYVCVIVLYVHVFIFSMGPGSYSF